MEEKLMEKLEQYVHQKEVLKELRRLTSSGHKSLVVEYKSLVEFNKQLADFMLDSPQEFLKNADEILERITKIPGMRFRIKNIDKSVDVRHIRSVHIGKFIQVEGILTRASEVRPEIKIAVFKCRRCGEEVQREQLGEFLVEPLMCNNPNCGGKGKLNFDLVIENTQFRDWQSVRVQEPPAKLRGGRMPRHLDGIVRDDLVDKGVPGNHAIITGVLHALQSKFQKRGGQVDKVLRMILFVNNIDIQHKGVDESELTEEDEKKIEELVKDPWVSNKIIQSISPAITGHEDIKEAIALQLFGCDTVILTDDTRIRGDTHLLLTGDPGCLVDDERIVLGNGAIVKLGELGTEHLQPLNQQVLTGQGYRRAVAARFHVYRNQPILEVITESGKSIKGTFNHPLLVLEKQQNQEFPCPPRRVWKRLDEIRPGDRLATVSWIPCSITAPVKTGWKHYQRKLGPRPKCKLPSHLDKEVAALLGYMLGDGWVRKTRFAFNVNSEEKDLLPILSSIVKTKFGLQLKSRSVKRMKSRLGEREIIRKNPILEVEAHSTDVAANLSFLREKRVPALVMKSGNEVVAEFLAWLFEADGCVFSKGRGKRSIQLKSSNIELLRDVQILLLRFGIHSRIVENNLNIRQARSIFKFSENIGFRSKKKKDRLVKLVVDCKNLDSRKLRKSKRSERVVTVRQAGFADVYDIEVPQGHRFIANGIISHNTAKSQMLKWVSSVAPRGLYTSGMKATGAGLTATAVRDEIGGGWTLEAGALVIADGGLASIDEFEKMNKDDAASILESMEQQTISVAKAGIVATLNTRTAVLAAANPRGGRFDPNTPIPQQLELNSVLLSRFDLIFIIKDEPKVEDDRAMAKHVVQLHSEPKKVMKAPLDSDFLRKVIIYAKKKIHPKFDDKEAQKAIADFYVEWRRSAVAQGRPLPITVRQLEALIRLSKSYARLRFSDQVTVEDTNRAINLVKRSLEQIGLDTKTGAVDIDLVMTGMSKSQRDNVLRLFEIIQKLETEYGGAAPVDEVKKHAISENISEKFVEYFITKEKDRGTLYSPTHDTVARVK